MILNIDAVSGWIIPSMLANYLSTYNIRVSYALSCGIFMTGIEKVSSIIVLIILYRFISGMFEFYEKLFGLTVIKVLHWLYLHLCQGTQIKKGNACFIHFGSFKYRYSIIRV